MINFLFLLSTFILFIMALRLMSGGFAAARQLGAGKFIETKRTVTKPPHPELSEVKPGDELLVVNFTPDEEFKRRVMTSDTNLQQSLKNRIDEINDPWYDDDDDDDGDVPAVVRR